MLGSWLAVALVAMPVALVLLFTPLARRGSGPWRTAAVAGVLGACSGIATSLLLARPAPEAASGGMLLALGVCVWLPACRAWSPVGVLAWGASCWAGGLYLLYMLVWTSRAQLSVEGTAVGLLLWVLELVAFLLGLAYLWEMVDVLGRRAWSRRTADWPPVPDTGPGAEAPFVSLHVPAHNEPPEMVVDTLRALLALDYPRGRYEVLLIDDNTDDEDLWRPVESFCADHPDVLRFHHLEDWPGFKSGALNYALSVTSPEAEVIGVVDADYVVDPDYLRANVGAFVAESELAFLQTPQDYRDWEQSAYYRRLYYSYSYFFEVSQPSRDERDAAIFGGTMGLIRRSALVEVGGWDEWCITEDAELSLRLLRAGWSGRHVSRSFGAGVMPLTFDALKRQRYRWCFGGIQILRMHWRSLLPSRRRGDDHLTPAQRWAYLSGALQWFGDLVGLLFFVFLLASALDLALGGGLVFRRLSGFLLVAVPVIVLVNLGRTLALVRRATGASWRDAFGAFGIWLALGWTVALASVRGSTAKAGVFLRTPKTRGEASWGDAVRANPAETSLALLGGAAIVLLVLSGSGSAAPLVVGLLALPVAGYLSAPVNTVAALRADLPDQLRRRRRTERVRAWASGPLRPARVAGATALVVTTAALALMVLTPTTPSGPGEDLFGDLGSGGLSSAAPTTPVDLPSPTGSDGATPSPADSAGGGGSTPGATAGPGAGQSTGASTTPTTSPTRASASATPVPTSVPPTPAPTATPTASPTPTGTPLPTPTVSQRPTVVPTPTRTTTTRPTPSPTTPSPTRKP